jgi:uncharacterized OB-fold protein
MSARVLPPLTDANREFWTGGRDGRLLVPRCGACRRWVLPPSGTCPGCGSPTAADPVSGRARVLTWTVNHQKFHPAIDPPNLIAIVVLAEQDDLRLATNLVGVEAGDVFVDMPVEVVFENQGEVAYPLFRPVVA